MNKQTHKKNRLITGDKGGQGVHEIGEGFSCMVTKHADDHLAAPTNIKLQCCTPETDKVIYQFHLNF